MDSNLDLNVIDVLKCGPVFIHFKHENYEPIYMKPDDDGKIEIRLMVPNTRLFFFFTENQMHKISKDYMDIWLEEPELIKASCACEDHDWS